jgi:hypothetical protein
MDKIEALKNEINYLEEINKNMVKLIEKIDYYNSFEYKMDTKRRSKKLFELYKEFPYKQQCHACKNDAWQNCYDSDCKYNEREYNIMIQERNRQNMGKFGRRY